MNKVFVASFTRAAAAEIAGRNKNAENVGTLHAHGYRALGKTRKVAENKIAEWNEDHPHYALGGGKNADVDEVSEFTAPQTDGDKLYAEMQMNRTLMIPRERWRAATRAFATRWHDWKGVHGLLDYTDMIEIPYRDVNSAPGSPSVGFFDEAQDFTPLEFALVRKWGAQMDYIVMCGDDDQTIFAWAGARAEVMLEGEPAKKIVLEQSYRVPRTIHALAQKTIQSVRKREPKEYKPRDAEGEVRQAQGLNYRMPEGIISDIERRYPDKKVMVLATCSYMLQPLIAALRKRGIPFHNPYRRKAGAWNPLRTAAEGEVSSADRLLAFIEQVPYDYGWTPQGFEALLNIEQFISWYDILLAKGNIPRGEKEKIIQQLRAVQAAGDEEMGVAGFLPFFERESEIWQYWSQPDRTIPAARWYAANVASAKARALEFPLAVFERRGAEALKGEPKIVIGTIHSVKGGEADAVYVLPDLSYNGYLDKNSSADATDANTRLKYVAYTRARESLILCGAATAFTM